MRRVRACALMASAALLGCFAPKSVTVRALDAAAEGAVPDAPLDVAPAETSSDEGGTDAPLDAVVDAPDAADEALDGANDAPDDAPREAAPDATADEALVDAPFDAPFDAPLDARTDALLDASADVTADVVDAAVPGDTVEAGDAALSPCPRPEQARCREVVEGTEEFNCRDIEYGMRASSGVPITNCGACGRSCASSSEICLAGTCCADRTAFCPPPAGSVPSNLIRTQLQADPYNCGACGVRCGDLETCTCGACRCLIGYTSCSGACVDVQSSRQHCGACGVACAGGQACVRGRCEVAPAHPQSCAEAGVTTEGPHTLYFGNDATKPYQARCGDLATGPTTWISLTGDETHNYVFDPRWVTDGNVAPAGTTVFGPGLLTIYDRVRFEPEYGRIVISDTRGSRSTGSEKFSTAAWFGLPSDCNWSMPMPRAIGRANVDLAGTPFSLVSRWIPRGFFEQGETVRMSLRSVDVTGGGHCGANYPDGFDYPNRALYIRVAYSP